MSRSKTGLDWIVDEILDVEKNRGRPNLFISEYFRLTSIKQEEQYENFLKKVADRLRHHGVVAGTFVRAEDRLYFIPGSRPLSWWVVPADEACAVMELILEG